MKTRTNVRKHGIMRESIILDSRALEAELRLQQLSRMGFEVKFEWLPGTKKSHEGKLLTEEVIGDTIFIYASNLQEAQSLVAHGFVEWLLNTHSKPYRDMINKLIEVFETHQYQNKERIVGVLERILERRAQ